MECLLCKGGSPVYELGSGSEPRDAAGGHSHARDGRELGRMTSNSSSLRSNRPRGPRLIVPPNVMTRDHIDRAMAINPGCGPEDSPTWYAASPTSTSLAFYRIGDPDGAVGRENAKIREIADAGKILGQELGKSRHRCIWTESMVDHMSSGLVVIEARRRIRKAYQAKHDVLTKELEADVAAQKSGGPTGHFLTPIKRQEKTKEAEMLHNMIEDGFAESKSVKNLAKDKDEAMRRAMQILEPRYRYAGR
ncbi:hypothetical protein PG990_000190 [Apiospora arundinis]